MTELGGGFDIYAHLREQPGAEARCPHCNGVAGVVPHPELVLVCKLCGAPRIPSPDGSPFDPSVLVALKKADAARKRRGMMTGVGIVGSVSLVFSLFVTLLTFLIGTVGWALLPLLLFVAPSVALILFSRAKRASSSKEVAAAVDAAWVAAAPILMRSGKIKSAADLTSVLGVEPQRAQQIMTLLTVESDIGGSGVRIGDGPVVAQVPVDPRFAALEAKLQTERQAEAEAAAVLPDASQKGRAN